MVGHDHIPAGSTVKVIEQWYTEGPAERRQKLSIVTLINSDIQITIPSNDLKIMKVVRGIE